MNTSLDFSTTLTPLVVPTAVASALTTVPSTRLINVGVLFVVGMALWALCTISISAPLVTSFDAFSTLPMPSTGINVGVIFGVFVLLGAVSNIRLPVQAVNNSIVSVFNVCTPVEIRQKVVGPYVVSMATDESRWSFANKRHQHKQVNQKLTRLAISVQRNGTILTVPVVADHHWLQRPTRQTPRSAPATRHLTIQRTHSAVIRNLVIGIVFDGQPSFVGHGNRVT